MDSENKVQKSSKKKNSAVLFMIVGILSGLAVVGLAFGIYSLVNNLTDSPETINASNGVDEINELVQASTIDFIDSLTLENIAENKDVINFESLAQEFDQSSNELKYLKPFEGDLENKTVHTAFDMTMEMSSPFGGDVTMSFKGDSFQKYPKNIDDSLETTDPSKLFSIMSEMDKEDLEEQIGKVEINSDFELNADQGSDSDMNIEGNVDLYLDGLMVYMRINDLNFDGTKEQEREFKNVELLEDKVISIDLSDFMDQYLEVLAETYSSQGSFYSPDMYLQLFADSFKKELALEDFSANDLAAIERISGPIKDVIKQSIGDLELFENIRKVDPIREDSNSVCHEGALNQVGIVDTLENMTLDIMEIVTEDKAYKGEDFETVKKDLEKQFDDLRDALEASKFDLDIRICTDKSDKYFTGFGIDTDFEMSDATFNIVFDMLYVDYDSDHKIDVPESDIDYTEEFNQIINQSMMTAI